mgnify:CR=1 FL=1
MTIAIYHNPRCSKSRAALKLLEESGAAVKVVLYLETPPSEQELRALLKKLGVAPRALMRTKEARFRELGLDAPGVSDDNLIRAMVENPILIERPIAIAGRRAVIGRPPETVLGLL